MFHGGPGGLQVGPLINCRLRWMGSLLMVIVSSFLGKNLYFYFSTQVSMVLCRLDSTAVVPRHINRQIRWQTKVDNLLCKFYEKNSS